MPTILRIDGFRVVVYLPDREHPPAHVHVYRTGADVVIKLGTTADEITVREVNRMARADVARAFRIVLDHADLLRAAWRTYHDRD